HNDTTIDNYKDNSFGYIRNARRGLNDEDNCIVSDIVVTDKKLVKYLNDTIEAKGKLPDLSCGLEYKPVLRDGKIYAEDINFNHVAIVKTGRAGISKLRDSINIKEDSELIEALDEKLDNEIIEEETN